MKAINTSHIIYDILTNMASSSLANFIYDAHSHDFLLLLLLLFLDPRCNVHL